MAFSTDSIKFTLATSSGNKIITFTDTSDYGDLGGGESVTDLDLLINKPDSSTINLDESDLGLTLGVNGLKNLDTTIVSSTSSQEQFPDGIYTFKFTLYLSGAGASSYTLTRKIYLYATLQCSVLNKATKLIPDTEYCVDNEDLMSWLYIGAMYDAFEYAIQCGDSTRAANLYNHIDKKLKSINCS